MRPSAAGAGGGAGEVLVKAVGEGSDVPLATSVDPGVGLALGLPDGDGPPQAVTRMATTAANTGPTPVERVTGAWFGRVDRSITKRYAGGPDPDAVRVGRDVARGLRPRCAAASRTMPHNRDGMGSMKAALRDRYGPPDVVRVEDIARPEPKDGEILVRVVCASVNRADLDGILPKPQFTRLFLGLRRPRNHRIGLDVAGVVEAVGVGVTRFRPGDRVFSDLYPFGQGAFAEYVTAPERAFALIPDDVTFEDAATLPHSAILAVQGLRQRNGDTIRAGDKVLIDGASGNVGPFAVQIAKLAGAEVTGVCRGSKVDYVRSLGADHVIDYTTTDYTQGDKRYDWILAADSHQPVLRIRRVLKPSGVYVTLGGDARSIVSAVTVGAVVTAATAKSAGLMWWWRPFAADDVATLLRLVTEGNVRPSIDRRYPLDEIVAALRWVHDGNARGKVVVQVG